MLRRFLQWFSVILLVLVAGSAHAANEVLDVLVTSPLTKAAIERSDHAPTIALVERIEAHGTPRAELRRLQGELVDTLELHDEAYATEIRRLREALLHILATPDGAELVVGFEDGGERSAVRGFERRTVLDKDPRHSWAVAQLAMEGWRRGALKHTEAVARLRWATHVDEGGFDAWMQLAQVLNFNDDSDRVVAATRAALRAAANDQQRADALRELGKAQRRLGQNREALASFEERGTALAGLLAASPDDPALLRQVLENLRWRGSLHMDHLSVSDGLPVLERAVQIAGRMVQREPANEEWRRSLALCHTKLAEITEAMGRMHDAREHLGRGIEAWTSLTQGTAPKVTDQRNHADALGQLGHLELREGRFDSAKAHYAASAMLWTAALEADPDHASTRFRLGQRHAERGEVDLRLGDYVSAERQLREGYDKLRKVAQSDSRRSYRKGVLGEVARALVEAEAQTNRGEGAARHRQVADAIDSAWLNATADVVLDSASEEFDDFVLAERRARAHESYGRWEEALASWRLAMRILQNILAFDPDNRNHQAGILDCHAKAVASLRAREAFDEAEAEARAVVDGWQALVDAVPADRQWQAELATAWFTLGEIRMARGQEGRAAFDQSARQWAKLVAHDGRVVRWQVGLQDANVALGR